LVVRRGTPASAFTLAGLAGSEPLGAGNFTTSP
jgi:hypothetical protein